MNKKERDKLEKTLTGFFKEIHKIYIEGDFREESFYPAFKTLIEECSKIFFVQPAVNILVLPRKADAGIPDFRIGKDGEIVGYIEAKSPDASLEEIEDSEQIKRYRDSLPNLILTNFLEFRIYKEGVLIDKVEAGRQFTLRRLKFPPQPENLDLFIELLQKFFSFSSPKIKKSSALSVELAKRTRYLEYILQEELSKENEEITSFYKAFKEELIEGLTKERFADLYAQTITYGLFAARMKVQNGFKKEIAWKSIPESLSLLREIFYSFTGPSLPESVSWVVDEIIQVLATADIPSILKEFKTTRWEEDPVIHFYETFLATYNPKERARLGVYYTPLPVVSYIVKSIHKILKERFGKTEGLATTDVTLLDPAAGTLTFVVQAIKQVQKELHERKKEGLITSYIEEHILPHFHAFEILVAPYTVGHFKVSMVLEDMGYQYKKGGRFQFYLTNSLEMKEPGQRSFLVELSKEGQEAKKIKEEVPILIVLGNPPYSVSSENKSDFIEALMNDYKQDVRDERNIQPLSDDYIKFIRFAHWKIVQAGRGILGFITNNSYLSGVIHRGMRKKLFEAFDEIYILNLHGSSRIGECAPQGGKDENVFDIQQGVAIALFVKHEKEQQAKIFYSDLWGVREEKYKYLFNNDIQTTKWKRLKSASPYYFFVPKDFSLIAEYEKFWSVKDIFREWSSGVKTHRDNLVVGFRKDEILQRLRIFISPMPDDMVRQALKLKDTGTWNLSEARKKIKDKKPENEIYPISYRPFDARFFCYEPVLIDRTRLPFMNNLKQKNITLLCMREVVIESGFSHIFVINEIPETRIFLSNRGAPYIFPLYLYPDKRKDPLFDEGESKTGRIPNFTTEFLQAIKSSLGEEPTPEENFFYIYATLYSPTYRKRYEEFLKIDFPKIPLPSNYQSFKKLSHLGEELVDLHLLKHPALAKTDVGVSKSGSNIIDKVVHEEKTKRVYINKERYFDGVSNDIWEYQIGAYQVMEKYLKDRKGRKLSLDETNHYLKVAKAIQLTMKIQEKIDRIFNSN